MSNTVIPSGRSGDDKPRMTELLSNIVVQYAAHWERLGLELGLKDYHIANISADNVHNPHRSVDSCRAVLEQWLREMPSPTWGKLDDAVKKIKLSNSPDKRDQFREFLEQAKRNNETEELCLYKLVIFGPPRVGKSSLFKVLVGEIPKKYSESTGVCDRLMFKVAITKDATGSKSTWHIIKIEDEISRLQSKLEEKQKLSKLTEERLPGGTVGASQHALLDVEKDMVKNVTTQSQNQSYSEIKYTDTLMVCYDSGGQPEFFDVMPSLATNPIGYVMVFDMSKDLNQPIKSEVFISNTKVILPDEIISIDLLKNAIASIQSSSSNTSLHNLLVVGTHLDQCKNPEEKIPKLDRKIYNDLVKGDAESLFRDRRKNKSQRKIDCTQIVHPIANLIECTDSIPQGELMESRDRDDVAQEIRTAIENMANNDNIRKETPINWLLFQLETQLKVTENNYIARKTCAEYAEKCYIKEDEIDHVLSYFHELGIILYYKEAAKDVVFSPQWLFDRISDIIFEKYNCNFKALEDIKKGRIKKDFLIDIYQNKIDVNGPLTVDHLLQVFINQNIMARFPEDEDLFFMPALLSPDPDRLVNVHLTLPESSPFLTECGKRSCERLYIKFENRYFPRGLFCSLATQFMGRGWFIQDNPRYNNILVFQLPLSADEYIGLFDCQTNLAVEMYQENNKDPSISPHKISELLYQFLKVFCKKIRFDSNFEFGFTCKRKGCNHFAAVRLKYPFLPEKSCKRCGKSKLNYDELIWITSPKDLTDILSSQHSIPSRQSDGVGTDVPDVSNSTIGVDCHRLLWQELNKNFGTASTIFVMKVGKQLHSSDYGITHEHADLAAENTFQLVNRTIACAANYSPTTSRISRMWERLLDQKGPKAGPNEQPAFEEAKRKLFVDYDKHKPTELYQDYLDKEIALKQKEIQIEDECENRYGDQWKAKYDRRLQGSKEYIELQRAAKVVQPHLDAIEVWQHGPLVHELNQMKQVLKENARSAYDYSGNCRNYYRVSLQPANWYQWFDRFQHEDKEWTQINVDSKNDDPVQAALYKKMGGSVTGEYSDVKISLKVRTVQISRPWLDTSILKNRNFTIDGEPPGSWSTGELSADNKGSFPLLTTQMIVARDITVTASTEMEHKAIADLFGVRSDSYKTINNNSIELKGTQVIGYTCDLLPKFPH